VIGAGTMGAGIAINFLTAGIPVALLESNTDALARGVATIRANFDSATKKGRLAPDQVARSLTLLEPTLDYGDLRDADLVIEAVFEDMAIKQQVFATLADMAKPGAILATN